MREAISAEPGSRSAKRAAREARRAGLSNFRAGSVIGERLQLAPAPLNILRERSALLIYPDSVEARERAARVVAAGGVFAFRTDTFYGLGADPFDAGALRALNELKGRDGKPILVLVSDPEFTGRLVARRTRAFDALSERHWPGALTIVAKARTEVPELITADTGTVGVRLPDDEGARATVRAFVVGLTATSANPAGRPPAPPHSPRATSRAASASS